MYKISVEFFLINIIIFKDIVNYMNFGYIWFVRNGFVFEVGKIM